MSRIVYRTGDRVRIINPLIVDRVGYPLTWQDLVPEFESHPQLRLVMQVLGIVPPDDGVIHYRMGGKEVKEFVRGCARAAVGIRHFGGRNRSIYTSVKDHLNGQETRVLSKRMVRTGTYYPAVSTSATWYAESEYEPAGLHNPRTHVLLGTEHGEIEAVNVMLVDRGAERLGAWG